MALCTHKTKSLKGSCGRHVGKGFKYCAFHLKKMQAQIKHGRYAQAGILGIPAKHEGIYQDFMQSERPFELKVQFATMNALYRELRELLDDRALSRRDGILKELSSRLMETLKGNPEKVAKYVEYTVAHLDEVLLAYVPMFFTLSAGDLMMLADLLEKISKVAMNMKKIQEGITMKVEIDQKYLVSFVQQVVMPLFPSYELRQQLVQRMIQFTGTGKVPEEVFDVGPVVATVGAPEPLREPELVVTPEAVHEYAEEYAVLTADPDDWDDPHSDSGDGSE
jgi:hypothetical protein